MSTSLLEAKRLTACAAAVLRQHGLEAGICFSETSIIVRNRHGNDILGQVISDMLSEEGLEAVISWGDDMLIVYDVRSCRAGEANSLVWNGVGI